jgi:hypothetical protein
MSDFYDLRELAEEMNKLREMKEKRISDQDRLEQLEALDAEFDYGKGGMEEYANGIDFMLIAGYYFEDYARQFAEDIGTVENNYSWPASCIDWKMAAEHLQMDYQCVTFEGREYWIRG